MATPQALIDKAKRYVRGGGEIEVKLPAGNRLGPTAVATMYLDADQIRYVWVGDDKTHIHDVLWIDSDADGQILLAPKDPEGMLLTIWTADWDNRLVDSLKTWQEQVKGGQTQVWLEGGLDGAVSYGDL